MTTRTWMTTPAGSAPTGDETIDERWVSGPDLPAEPELASRFRGVYIQAVVLMAAIAATLLFGDAFVGQGQDPGIGNDDGTVEQPTDA